MGESFLQYIAISGTVGSGKTTLLNRLLERLGDRADFHRERPEDNPYITDYYADSQRWSFHSQVAFLSLYFDDPRWRGSHREFFFFDRSFRENLIIARYRRDQQDLTEEEYRILCRLGDGIADLMPPIDKYIYLDCSSYVISEHMKARGRDYEEDLDMFYIFELKRLYDEWKETLPKEKTLVVNMDEEYDLEAIVRFIES